MADSTITISGTLGRDPDLRYTPGGRAVASVGVAVSRRFQRNGEWEEQTSWINAVVWGDLGEHFAASCSKGDRVIATGRLEQRSWEDKEGNKRSTVELVADDIGPSLKWAEATVERIQREDSGSRGGTSGGRAPDPVEGDEEPFITPAHERSL